MIDAGFNLDLLLENLRNSIEYGTRKIASGGWCAELIVDHAHKIVRAGEPQHRLYKIGSIGAVNPGCAEHERVRAFAFMTAISPSSLDWP